MNKLWKCLRSFTLVELLVVIAIISLLSALLVPALKSAKDSTKRIKCQSNLHQIGLGIEMYINEHDNYLPYAVTMGSESNPLGGALPPYLQDQIRTYLSGPTVGMGTNSAVFACPSTKMGWVLSTSPRNDYRYNYYFANGWSLATPQAGRKADSLSRNSGAALVLDMAWQDWVATDMPHDGINTLYADGHVAFVKAATFQVDGLPSETSTQSLYYSTGF